MSKSQLTPRQREVVAALADGLTFKQIGPKLGCSQRTAQNHCQGAKVRAGVPTLSALVAWHYRQRIAQLEAQLAYSKTFPRHD